jgi:hypothetical protein
MKIFTSAILLALLCAALPAAATTGKPAKPAATPGPKLLGTFGNWRAYSVTEADQPVCYMTLTIPGAKGSKAKRGDALLTITHRPAENSTNVFSYTAGYNYKSGSSVTLRIGKDSFDLFTAQDTAWSRDPATDRKIATELRAAMNLTITGTPANKGAKPLTDRLTLTGTAAAYKAIGKACGVETEEKPAVKPKKAKKKT